jgi:hypothetical protein
VDAELVAWVLVGVGVVLMAVLAVAVLGHVRRLGRERAAMTVDVSRRVARLQLLRATRRSRTR